jgi:hypothetical protein
MKGIMLPVRLCVQPAWKWSLDQLRFIRARTQECGFVNKNPRISIALLLLGSILITPAMTWGHSHSGLAFGLGLLGGYSLGYYGGAPYLLSYGYPSGYGFTPWIGFGRGYGYSSPPIVVAPPPPVYIQQQPVMPSQPQEPADYYWHYCRNPEGYYPYVKTCPDGWLQVLPQPDQ